MDLSVGRSVDRRGGGRVNLVWNKGGLQYKERCPIWVSCVQRSQDKRKYNDASFRPQPSRALPARHSSRFPFLDVYRVINSTHTSTLTRYHSSWPLRTNLTLPLLTNLQLLSWAPTIISKTSRGRVMASPSTPLWYFPLLYRLSDL